MTNRVSAPVTGVVVLLLLLFSSDLLSQERQVIRGAYLDFPPLALTNAAGQPEGTFITLANRLANEAGYDIVWQELPISRVYLYLRHGRIDLWLGSAGVQEIEPFVEEADFYPMEIRLNAYHRDSTPPVDDIPALEGKRLILIRGYTYWRLLDKFIESPDTPVTLAPDHQSAMRMLAFNRGDYLINFADPMNHILAQSPFEGLQVSPLLNWPLTLIFSRHTENLELVVTDINKAWRDLSEQPMTVAH